MSIHHSDRAHSKFSASGSERWLNCAASVEIEESSPPSPDTPWSKEGTHAHEGHEALLTYILNRDSFDAQTAWEDWKLSALFEMIAFVKQSVTLALKLYRKAGPNAEIQVEKRIYNTDIHEEMFGTGDVAIIQLYKNLDVFDFKYGQGHIVSPKDNTQLVQYALGLAAEFNWNFQTVTMHISQPRAGKNWHKHWKIDCEELRTYWRPLFVRGVARVVRGGNKPQPGAHCYWCRGAKFKTCPVKKELVNEKVQSVFDDNPFTGDEGYGYEKSPEQKEYEESYEETRSKKVSWEIPFDEEQDYENPSEESLHQEESFNDTYEDGAF